MLKTCPHAFQPNLRTVRKDRRSGANAAVIAILVLLAGKIDINARVTHNRPLRDDVVSQLIDAARRETERRDRKSPILTQPLPRRN